MIIAIFGRSGSGKTTIASIVASDLAAPLRNCGKEIRDAALAAGFGIADAPADVHLAVDEATRAWCDAITDGLGVVEGRFLDQVLDRRDDLVLIELRANIKSRAARLTKRLQRKFSELDVAQLDDLDDIFRHRMYSGVSYSPTAGLIETSGECVTECVKKVLSFVRSAGTPAPD